MSPSVRRSVVTPCARPRATVAASALMLALAMAFVGAACSDDGATELENCFEESLTVDIDGSCGAAEEVTLSAYRCQVTLYDETQPLFLPSHGALPTGGGRLRDGAWTIYGTACIASETDACTSKAFRICNARRIDWQIDLSCVDDQGAPTCQATLTE